MINKKIILQLFKPNAIFVVLYISIATYISLLLQFYNFESSLNIILFILPIPSFVISVSLTYFALKFIPRLSIKKRQNNRTFNNLLVFFLTFIICLLIFLIWYIGYKPGFFAPDTMNQLWQVEQNSFNDWHPFLHTLLFLKIPLDIFGNVNSIVIIQIIYFSLTISFLIETIYKFTNKYLALISLLFIILNPNVCALVLHPWKDVAFIISGTISFIFVFRIWVSNKQKSEKIIKLIVIAIFLALTTLFRHNGILFVLPLFLTLFMLLNKKQWWFILISFLAFLIMWKGIAIYSYDVKDPNNKNAEISGVLLTIMYNTAKHADDKLDEETKDFIYSITPKESIDKINNTYVCTYAKFDHTTNLKFVEDAGVFKLFFYTCKCFIANPGIAFHTLFYLTGMCYAIHYNSDNFTSFSAVDNSISSINYQISDNYNDNINSFLNVYTIISRPFYGCLGIIYLVIIIVSLLNNNLKKREDFFRFSFSLPLLVYTFITMMMIPDHGFRYFMITFIIFPLLMISQLYDNKNCLIVKNRSRN